jgi:putative glutamine amidotransferase
MTGGARPPVIGLCAHVAPIRISVYDSPATFVPQAFVDRVVAAGGLPVLLPPLSDVDRALSVLDGLLLLPGWDVDPARYSAAPHPESLFDPVRDAVELALLGRAIDAGLPTLGICRGMQLLNTLCGGTLHQHLPEIVGHEAHSPGDVVFGQMTVRPLPGSRVAAMLGAEAVVPCHHHQAVDRVGADLTVTAVAEDGVVEAVELAGHPFAVAVQWHAEQSDDLRPFQALVAAAARYRPVRSAA